MKKKKISKKNFFDMIDVIIDKIEYILTKIFSCKWLYYIGFILLAFFVYFLNLKSTMQEINVDNNKYLNYYYIGSLIVASIIVFLLIFNNKVKNMEVHKRYLIFSIVLGICYLFASPMFTQSDESFHFIRAYQVSNGHFISPYDEFGNSYDVFPKSIYDTIWDDEDLFPEFKNYEDSYKESKIKLNKNNTVVKDVRASNYVFLNYFPHAIGMKIGIILNQSPYMIGLLGRITNMIICIIIITIGLKIIPVGKKMMSILLLAPSIISYIASLSADGLIIAMSFLLISLVMKFMNDKTKLNWKWYLLLLLIVAFVSTCKAAYLPIIGILIFLPYDCFKNKKTKWLYSISLIIFGILFSFSWISVGNVSLVDSNGYVGLDKYIRFIKVFANTTCRDIISYVENIFAGNYMYECQVNPYKIIPMSYLSLLLISFFSEKSKLKVRTIQKMITIGIIVCVIILVSYALFISNTGLNATFINGIQGRYFVPIILLLPFFIKNSKIKVKEEKLFDISLVLNAIVLLNMISVFSI